MDANNDGKITPDEFDACVLSPDRFDATIEEFAVALSNLGAPAGNGLVPRPVFVALMIAIGFDPANINALFDAFGPNAADQIEARVWVEGIKDYYQPDLAAFSMSL